MRADVALAERAVDRVGDRMQRHVGVGMARELLVVRDQDAAQPDAFAGREGVDVETLADPDLGDIRGQPRLGLAQILHRRHFHIIEFAVEDEDGVSSRLGDRRVVGQIGAGGVAVRLEDQIEAESLRRLNRAKRRALGRGDDAPFAVDLFDRVGHRRRGHGGAVEPRRLDRPRDQFARSERSGAVVDQYEIRPQVRLRLEAVADAALPRRAAEDRRGQRARGGRGEAGDRRVVEIAIVGMNDDRRRQEFMRERQRLDRVADERPPRARQILLRDRPAEPRAPPRGDDDEGNARRQGGLRGC